MYNKKENIVIHPDINATQDVSADSFIHVYDHDVFHQASQQLFRGEHWQSKNAIIGHACGRGITWFFEHKGNQLVLRHYFRGGLIRHFLTDQYFYLGLERTRAYKECELLRQLASKGLPVPRPIAFQVKKTKGMYYTCDVVMTRIQAAEDLVSIMQKRALTESELHTIGATIRLFHDQGVSHHDLNAHNILLDANQVGWLVDFDQGELRNKDDENWKQAKLKRLLKSLRKEQKRLPTLHWQEAHWPHILDGYHTPKG